MKKRFAALCLTCSARQRTAPVLHGQHLGHHSLGRDPLLRPDRPSGKGQQPDLEGSAGEPEIRRGHGLG